MSGMRQQIVQTIGNTIPASYQPFFTGRTKKMYSPLQGRTLEYLESYTIRVTSPKGTPPDLEAVKTKINTDFANGTPDSNNAPVDAQCDSILVIQGAVQDTYKLRTWIAETQPAAFIQANQARIARLQGRTLIAPLLVLAIIAVAFIISAAIVFIVVVVLGWLAFMAVLPSLLPGKPTYVGGTPNDPITYEDWAAYLSSQNLLYWYVCPKCGAGFGSKAAYPNIIDVPPEEVQAFEEHKANCLGIPQTNYDPTWTLIWGVIAIVGAIGIIYVVTKFVGTTRPKRY